MLTYYIIVMQLFYANMQIIIRNYLVDSFRCCRVQFCQLRHALTIPAPYTHTFLFVDSDKWLLMHTSAQTEQQVIRE